MLEDVRKERIQKLEKLQQEGINPYPATVARTHTAAQAHKSFAALARSKKKISLAGRLMGLRDQGNLLFGDLRDESGQFQIVIKKDLIKNFKLVKDTLDRGDFISVEGPLFKTQKGQESVEVRKVTMATKTLLPLPTDWYGISDLETRLRQRYLDLIMNQDVAEMFRKKSRFWNACRSFLLKENFLEIDMSALEPVPGGAEAEPFVTHHNALNQDFYLRISLELPLKKLVVGGYERVFEIGRVFRNEGIDKDHLQDYMQMECYWAYADYKDLMKLVEKMYKHIVRETCGTLTTTWHGEKINWGRRWDKIDYSEAFRKANGFDPIEATRSQLLKKAEQLNLDADDTLGKGRLIDLVYKKTVRPHFIQPSFLINHPVDISPLSKRSPGNPNIVERLQPVACASELGNGWSELNDPLDQRSRFEAQMKLREAGDNEAQMMDEDFVEALEYGMPPTAGFGMSERLFAILMDKPIRETVFFPLMRNKD